MHAFRKILLEGLVGLAVVTGIAMAMAVMIAAAGRAAYAGTDVAANESTEPAINEFINRE